MTPEIVFWLEEESAEKMLRGFIPRLLPDRITLRFRRFEGKQDMAKRLPVLMRKYQNPHARFVVIVDQDSHPHWRDIKGKLQTLCAGIWTFPVLIRIACHELESWYLGDLAAVERALEIPVARYQHMKKFRNPDRLNNAKQELQKLTACQYRELDSAERIAPYLSLTDNYSCSFLQLVRGIQNIRDSILGTCS